MNEPTALWIYAVTGPEAVLDRAGPLTGVAGGTVGLVRAAGLAAVASPVELAEFGAEPLRRNLEKLPWLEAVARAHHQVIAAASRVTAVVPMRLATVYRSQAAVAGMLSERASELKGVLARTANCSEWGVKAYLTAPAAEPGRGDSEPAAASAGKPGSGADYLRRRRAQLTADEDARHAAAAGARHLHAELCAVAAAAGLHRPQDPQLSGRRAPMVMNGTYLVDDRRRERFAATVDRAAAQNPALRVETTGPWPPYSFASTESIR